MSIILICPNVFLKNFGGVKNFKVDSALSMEVSRRSWNVNGKGYNLLSKVLC